MSQRNRLAVSAFLVLSIIACAAPAKKPLVDPFPLRFPLTEVGSLEIDGHVVGPPRAQEGTVHFTTREGYLTAVVVTSRAVLWRSRTEDRRPSSSELPGDVVLSRDGGLLRAFDAKGRPVWEFRAKGAVPADPVQYGNRLYFGDEARMFYCLNAVTGKVKWRRRLQGSPIHPAVVGPRTVIVAASNSVVYVLSRKGGSILSWEVVPSRILYLPVAAGPLVLVSSASPTVMALDLRTGKQAGQYEAPGPLVAGAVWSPPFVVLFVEDEASGRQKIVFLRSR